MRVVAQRVSSASVTVAGECVGRIERGLMLLVGFAQNDGVEAVDRVADKISGVRIFDDANGKMNLSISEIGGSMLVVSQFTLYADVRKGRRPSFSRAAQPELALSLYQHFVARLVSSGCSVECGRFGEKMLVELENDGPVTVIFDSAEV